MEHQPEISAIHGHQGFVEVAAHRVDQQGMSPGQMLAIGCLAEVARTTGLRSFRQDSGIA